MLVYKPYNHIDSKKEFSISRPDGQAAKTPPFHGGNGGSIPPRVTKWKSHREKARTKVRAFSIFLVSGIDSRCRRMLKYD